MLGLTVVLYPNPMEYGDVVMNNYVGFKALVHSPFDFPEVSAKGFTVDENKEIFVGKYFSLVLFYRQHKTLKK